MKVLKEFKMGDAVPKGAKFLCTKEIRDDASYKQVERLVHSGIFTDTIATYKVYDTYTVYVYEVEEE